VGFVAIVLAFVVHEIAATLAVAGYGLLVVAAFHAVPLGADALGWWALLDRRERPALGVVMRARWAGEAVNSLLPVMQLGGAVVRAQMLARAGVGATTAGASVVVDVTLLVATQLVFTCLGLAIWLGYAGGGDVALAAAVGTALMASAVVGFVRVQRRGLFAGVAAGIERVVGRGGAWRVVERGVAIDARVRAFHRESRKLAASAGWHLASWIVGAGETWLALWFLGHPIDPIGALLLESLGQAVRAAAFAVPGGLGFQEGGYLVLGGTLGLPPETAIALSLAKRVRELGVGLPGLVVWQAESAAWLRGGVARKRGAESA
jgi:putative membrane protein